MKQHYVIGFAFDPSKERVALIMKNRGPAELVGKLNGIGGKIELGESDIEAMIREFSEEAGVVVPHWERKGEFWGVWGSVQVFTVVLTPAERDAIHSCTDEEVIWCSDFTGAARNVPLLLQFCLRDDIERFSFKEAAPQYLHICADGRCGIPAGNKCFYAARNGECARG